MCSISVEPIPSTMSTLNRSRQRRSVCGASASEADTQKRTDSNEPALQRAYLSGAVNETNNLKNVAIIDLRGTDQGEFHDVYRAVAIRARLERENGTFANQVIWEGVVPLLGDVNYTKQGLIAIDRWLAVVEKDGSTKPLSQRIIDDKPADIHDQCTDGAGTVIPNQQVCQLINPVFSTPAVEAGESIATDTMKCQLKPLRRSDYNVQFTPDEWTSLQKAFPSGVCDWSKPGVDQTGAVPWRTYQDAHGNVIYGGRPLGRAPGSQALRTAKRQRHVRRHR